MNRNLISIAAAVFLAVGGYVHAQSAAPGEPQAVPPAAGAPAGQRAICAKAKDPARCEERRQEAQARLAAAKQACAGKQADARGACMTEAFCAQAPDPQVCRERAKVRSERMAQLRQACGAKQGDERRACVREQRRSARPAQ